MEFTFKHPKTGEVKKAEIPDEKIRAFFEYDAREQIGCNCEPIGETNVVECNCSDYFDQFELVPNVELTGAARLYRAVSSDRRERG